MNVSIVNSSFLTLVTPIASKKHFFIKLSIFCWSPKSPLEVPDVRTFRGLSRDVPGTSRAGWEVITLQMKYLKSSIDKLIEVIQRRMLKSVILKMILLKTICSKNKNELIFAHLNINSIRTNF